MVGWEKYLGGLTKLFSWLNNKKVSLVKAMRCMVRKKKGGKQDKVEKYQMKRLGENKDLLNSIFKRTSSKRKNSGALT